MDLFDCKYTYETPQERGHGRIALCASDEAEAIAKVRMIVGADSSMTDCEASRCGQGFIRLGSSVDATETEITQQQAVTRERAVAQRFEFDVAARATVIAVDRWEAYRKLANMVRQNQPPVGLKRKVVGKEPVETMSRFDQNAIFRQTQFLQGGKASPK